MSDREIPGRFYPVNRTGQLADRFRDFISWFFRCHSPCGGSLSLTNSVYNDLSVDAQATECAALSHNRRGVTEIRAMTYEDIFDVQVR